MADTKISNELAAGTLDGSELTEIVQSGNNRRTTTQDIANLAASISIIAAGTTSATLAARFGHIVNVVDDFGADPTGVVDCTTKFNAAAATGLTVYIPTGTYKVTSDITCATKGQIIYGDGATRSTISVAAAGGFTSGVFKFTSGEEGPFLKDIGITFAQPDTATRGSLTNYKPAIYAQNTPRFRLQRLAIYAAIVAVDMRGNSGGAYIEDCQISGFGTTSTGGGLILLDGSEDTVRIVNTHIWPFALSVNQQSIFDNTGTIGISSGRTDDLRCVCDLFFCGTGISFFYGSVLAGVSFGSLTACSFDSYAGIVAIGLGSGTDSGPQFNITGCYFSKANDAASALNLSAGHWVLSGNYMAQGNSGSTPLVNLSDATGWLDFNWSSGFIESASADISDIVTSGDGNCNIALWGIKFIRSPNTNYTLPVINIGTGTRATIQGCRISDKGTGTGTFITVSADEWHNIIGNTAPGWVQSFPRSATPLLGVYQANNSSSPATRGTGLPQQEIVASASTCDIGQVGTNIQITGTTTITSFGTNGVTNCLYFIEFANVLTLTYNATSMVLPGNANITTAVGDFAIALSEGSSGNWAVLNYYRQSGQPVANISATSLTGGTLASGVTASSLTSVGTITSGTWQGTAVNSTHMATATTGAQGAVKPDGTTITISGSTISTAGVIGTGTANALPIYTGTNQTLAAATSASLVGPVGTLLVNSINTAGSGNRVIIEDNGSNTIIGNATVVSIIQNSLFPGTDNAFTSGGSSNRWSAVWAVNGTIQTSDASAKTDVVESDLGLEFINKLKPVSYTWTGDIEERRHYGLVAQEIKDALAGRPFGGIYEPEDEGGDMGLTYHSLIAPLIKAVQELSAEVEALKAERRSRT